MLFSIAIVALLGVHMAFGQTCVQERYDARDAFEVAAGVDGFDVTLWHRDGVLLLGELTGGVADATAGTLTVAADATSNVIQLASFDDLQENGPQEFLILLDLAQATTAMEPVEDNCLITVGGGETAPGFCLASNGQLRFPDRFALKPSAAPGGADLIAVRITRTADLLESGKVNLDFQVNVGGTVSTFADVSDEHFEIGNGLTLNAPPADTTHTITQLIVLEGRERQAGDANGFFTSAAAALGEKGSCRFQEWSLGTGVVVVPGSGADNLVLTLTTTNFGPTDLDETTAEVQFLPAEELQISNFTAIAAQGAAINVTAFSGALTSGGALTIDALTVGSSYTFTFTATVFNCAPTALPLVDSGIVVDGSTADIYVQRQARLQHIEEDLRRFDFQGLPIAAGCGVPFPFTVQIFNEGPSCVENLVLQPNFDSIEGITVLNGETAITAEKIMPGRRREGEPVRYEIQAGVSAGNIREQRRALNLVGPIDGGVNSVFVNEPITEFSELQDGVFPDLFAFTYDVTRYADLTVDVEFDKNTVEAGTFATPTTPNLVATVSVSNAECIEVLDIVIAVQIDLPEGAQLLRDDGTVVTEGTVHETIAIDRLGINDSTTFTYRFAVCAATKGSNSGVSVSARLQSAGATSNDGLNGPSERETKEPFTEINEYATNGVVLIRRFDDSCDKVAQVALQAEIKVALTCDEPVLVATYRNDNVEKEAVAKSTANSGKHHNAKRSTSWHAPKVDDVDLQKVTRCRVTVDNTGGSDCPLKILNNWDLPNGSRFVRWSTNTGQFLDGVWALRANSQAINTDQFCPERTGEQATLELDFLSTKPGALQIVSRVDETATVANLSGQQLGNAVTIDV